MSERGKIKGRRLIIAAIVCSLLFILPLVSWVGMVLAIVAVRTVEEPHRKLALATLALSIIAVMANLALIAIPGFVRFPLRSKTSEAKMSLRAIESHQLAFRQERGFFAAPPSTGNPGVPEKVEWKDRACSDACSGARPDLCSFSCIDFQPAGGRVFYQYACSANEKAFTCAASADLDGDGEFGAFVLVQVDEGSAPLRVPAIPGAQHCGLDARGEIAECRPGTF